MIAHKNVPAQADIHWYEASLPLQERRRKGHFSTPPALVEQILDACGYTPTADLSTIRVLDPACGSGNFLAAAAHRLLNYCVLAPLAPETHATTLQRNIWGFDPDPISCLLAKMQLSALSEHNALQPYDFRPHIHQGDALALPWRDPCVDLFLANPPYLAAKNADLSGYRATQPGQIDSYLLFLNLGLRIVRPNGWLGLVVPDPLLARANAATERTHLLRECTIHHLWHLDAVFPAHVGAVVIVAQKCPPPSTHAITWIRNKWEPPKTTPTGNNHPSVGAGLPQPTADLSARPPCSLSKVFLETDISLHHPPDAAPQPTADLSARPSDPLSLNIKHATVPQALFARQPHAEFRYLLNREPGSFIEQLHTYLDKNSEASPHFAPLSNFLTIRRGEELGQSSPHLIHNSHRPDASTQEDQEWYPVLRGGRDVRPYAITFNDQWITRQAIVKPLVRYLSPKLLVVKSTNRLQAALDTKGHVALQTLYLLQLCQTEKLASGHAQGTIPFTYASSSQRRGRLIVPTADLSARPVSLSERYYPQGASLSWTDTAQDDLYFYLALLNSRLLQMYTYMLHTAYKWVQPQIEQHVLARLPVPLISVTEKQQIIERAKLLFRPCDDTTPVVEWKEHMQHIYAEQERAIRALYDAALMGR